MAKPKAQTGTALTYPATTAYKQWVWKEIRRRGRTLQWLVDEMKRVAKPELMAIITREGPMYETISTATLSLMLGPAPEKKKPPPSPSNCVYMVALNRALGISPPPVSDPNDELSQIIDLFRDRWSKMDARDKRMLVEILKGPDRDSPGVDGDG